MERNGFLFFYGMKKGSSYYVEAVYYEDYER